MYIDIENENNDCNIRPLCKTNHTMKIKCDLIFPIINDKYCRPSYSHGTAILLIFCRGPTFLTISIYISAVSKFI